MFFPFEHGENGAILRLELIRKLNGDGNAFRTSVSLPPPGAVKMRLFGEPRSWDGKSTVYTVPKLQSLHDKMYVLNNYIVLFNTLTYIADFMPENGIETWKDFGQSLSHRGV